MEEIWKEIKGFEGLYQISNLGRIKGLPRLVVRNGKGSYVLKERILKHSLDKDGYHKIGLTKDGNCKQFFVHRLVYAAFVGDIPEGFEINHRDECKDNNTISNLDLMSHSENCNWGSRNERSGRKHRKKIIMDEDIEFCSLHEAAKYLGCSVGNIPICCKNPTHTIYGHHFKYKEESKQ